MMDIQFERPSSTYSKFDLYTPKRTGQQVIQVELNRAAFGTAGIDILFSIKPIEPFELQQTRIYPSLSLGKKILPVSETYIHSLPGEPYTLLQPIPVKIEHVGKDDFLASFEEANIGMSGETEQEALQNLVVHVLDVFETFSEEESSLGPEPARQLMVLKQYIKPQI